MERREKVGNVGRDKSNFEGSGEWAMLLVGRT